jgi:predicted AlkP superfamily pyrophosphatase or phosphodiesterase
MSISKTETVTPRSPSSSEPGAAGLAAASPPGVHGAPRPAAGDGHPAASEKNQEIFQ